jgi:PEP-CTERM motif-containing protein
MNRRVSLLFLVFVALFNSVAWANAPVAFYAATWSDSAIHRLDQNLNDLGSFPAGTIDPNGLTTDGSLIYSGHFTSNQVFAYDLSGTQQFNWSNPALQNVQGMALVNGEMAVVFDPGRSDGVTFLDPSSGAFIRSIPNVGGGTVEGMTYDGSLLWLLGDQLLGVDPATGSLVRSLPNAAIGTGFGGTGIALGGPNQFVLGSPEGAWFRVSSIDGSVISSGNNGLNMYDLCSATGVPEPSSLALAGIALFGLIAGTRAWRSQPSTS